MKEKKYIDRLYQEKFKDFEATPREAVWRSISAKLREEEDKKPVITPFWSRMAGIAAILALIFMIGDWIFPERTSAIADEKVEDQSSDKFEFPALGIAFTPSAEESASDEKKTPANKPMPEKTEVAKRKVSEVAEAITSEEKGISIDTGEITSAAVEEEKDPETSPGKISLFEEIAQREEQVIVESSKGSFEISTHAAPIYHGNFGKGNFLDPQFNNKTSQGEITYSYGINVAYAITDKIKIRSGVSKVNMSFNTNGVVYSAIIGPVPISGVAMSGREEDPQMSSEGIPSKLKAGSERATVGSLLPGMLNQKMGFIEVPVELEYNLIDKKFELNVIGGASTLFLDQNSVSVNSGSYSALGKASNLNQISFSTNVGLGLDYNLSEKFKLNLEPMLKYQLNTFNSASSENQPFYLGIYSGFSYKF